jgi:adenylate cyclase
MASQTEAALRRQLERKQRELDLILAVDGVRDSGAEPSAMLAAVVDKIADQFHADLGLLCLLDRDTGELELKVVHEHRHYPYHLDSVTLRGLAERALHIGGVRIWQEAEVTVALGVPSEEESLELASVPIYAGTEPLGLFMVARFHAPFEADDLALLRVAVSQLDSAIVQSYAHYELEERNKELETIYHIDQIRDRHLSFDEMLNAVLQELSAVVPAEMGFIMLFNPVGRRLEMRAVTHDDLFRVSPYYKVVERVAYESLERRATVGHNGLQGLVQSILCLPLVLNDEIIGVLGVVNGYGPEGFSREEQRLLNAIGSQMDTAIFEGLERRRLRRVLGRSLDPHVLEHLLRNPDVGFLKGERAEISVLYADLRGSTPLAAALAPELLVEFINDFLGQMTAVVLEHGATLDKYIGDEVMALFGAPVSYPDHALRAVRVALEMQAVHQAMMAERQQRGLPAVPIGIGLATGELTAGEMGCAERTEYTVIGPAANLGARLCGVAEAGQVLICETTYEQVREHIEAVPVTGLRLKGFGQNVTAYSVVHIKA